MSTPEPVRREADLSLTFSPGQILGGFALIAALILFLLRRWRQARRQR
jgi:hypothetical protein